MAISDTNVELRKDDVVASTPVDCDLLVYGADEIVLYYGNARVLAVVDTDYTVTLDNEGQPQPVWPTTFSITPLASLITKINALITANPIDEENVVWVRRSVEYTTDFQETDAFLRTKIAREFDRTIMRFQQLAYDVARLLGFKDDFEDAAEQVAQDAIQVAADAEQVALDRVAVAEDADEAAASAALASQWASLTGSLVATLDYSAKEWAVGIATRGQAGKGSAKDWATHTGGTVDGTDYSAKHWASVAASYVGGATTFQDTWAANSGAFPGAGVAMKGWYYLVTTAGTVNGVSFDVGDQIFARVDNASTTTYANNWVKVEGAMSAAEVIAALGFTPLNVASKAAGTDVATGTDDVKYVTSKAIKDGGVYPAADTATVKTGSSTVTTITPNNLRFHKLALKGWARVTISGGVVTVVATAGEVTGVTRSAAGIFNITHNSLATPYVGAFVDNGSVNLVVTVAGLSATQCTIYTVKRADGTLDDPVGISFLLFGAA